MLKRPPRASSSRAAKMAGESKWGKQSQSIDPCVLMRATECMSPIMP
jgi:hypothetical protein